MTADRRSHAVPKFRFAEFVDDGPWDAKLLGDLCYRVSETVGDSQLPPVSISAGYGFVPQSQKFGRDISGSQYSKYIWLRRGDFAYNRGNSKRFPQGCVYRLTEFDEAAASSAFYCFRLHEHLEPNFFIAFFENNSHGRQLTRNITSGARSNGLLNISADAFFGITVRVPPTAAEQQKIADCLESLDNLIGAESRKLEALRKHKQALMQQLFPLPGESVPRLRFPEFHGAREWKAKRIGDLRPYVTSGSRGWAAYYAPSGSLFVRITNLSRESIYLDLTDSKFVDLPTEAGEGSRTELRAGDVLISITADIGIIGYVESDTPTPAYINQHVALVRFTSPEVNGRFVAYFLASPGAQAQFRLATDNGTKAGMNLMGVEAMKLPLPLLPEQQRIAECLASIDALVAKQLQKLDTLKQHKQGLLQQLFPNRGPE